jgi:hypothetical protein
MLRSILKKFGLLALPFVLLLAYYIQQDPFKVLRHYPQYYQEGVAHRYITYNYDYVALENLKNQPNAGQDYQAFIIGSSKTRFLKAKDWQEHIGQSAKIYHFDAAAETLYGIERKLQWLDDHQYQIKDCILLFDLPLLDKTQDSQGHMMIKHPELSGRNPIDFQWQFVKAFFSRDFFFAYLDYKITGQVKPYMVKKYLFDDILYYNDNAHNELTFVEHERLIKTNPKAFYTPEKLQTLFKDYLTPGTDKAKIGTEQLALLQNIKRILEKQHSRYKIIIPPVYDQIAMNPADKKVFDTLFGAQQVFDFSGKNTITQDYHNFYEYIHFNDACGQKILQQLYATPPTR